MSKEKIVLQSQNDKYKDLIIADLIMQNAELQQQINDIGGMVADLILGGKEA